MVKKLLRYTIDFLTDYYPKKSLALSYHFFTTPRKGKIKGSLPLFLATAQQKKIYIDEAYIQTYQIGIDKPVVLLIHGWESNAARWEQLICHLGANYTFVCIDAPAMGKSSGTGFNVLTFSKFIGEALDYYQPQFVVAHSLGGFAYLYQLTQKDYSSVQKTVLLGCLDVFEQILLNYQKLVGFSDAAYNLLKAKLESLTGDALENYRSALFSASNLTATLIIQDRVDPIIPLVSAHHIYAQTQYAKLFETEGLGHSLQDKIVYDAVGAFISLK